MSTVSGVSRVLRRGALTAASVTALSLLATGCVVVHGEREVLPSATRAEAARALREFTAAYNAADKAYDVSRDAGHVTGALGAIDGARLKAGHINHPDGNSDHTPLKLTHAKFTIPRKAGWPRWFLADTQANKGGNTHWMLVFTRSDLQEPWKVAYLTLLAPDSIPTFRTDGDGWAEAVPSDAHELVLKPGQLSKRYTAYLKDGGKDGSGGDGGIGGNAGGEQFAPGPYTSEWRSQRDTNASRPGLARQYIDEPLESGDFAPLGLRTKDGGALVFFSSRHFEKQTAAAGTTLPAQNPDVRALTTGDPRQMVTLQFVANETVLDPPKKSGEAVTFLGRVQGLTGAQGG